LNWIGAADPRAPAARPVETGKRSWSSRTSPSRWQDELRYNASGRIRICPHNCPPCAPTMERQIERPNPIPLALVV
jgi:hypothetical protein